MKLDTAVLIGTHGTGSGIQQARAAPGIIDQDLHSQFLSNLVPPGAFCRNIKSASGIIQGTVCDGRIGCLGSRAVGVVGKGGNGVTQNGKRFSLQGSFLSAPGAGAVFKIMISEGVCYFGLHRGIAETQGN